MAKYAKILGKIVKKSLDRRPGTWLAERAGFTGAMVSRILNGTADVGLPEIVSLAEALEMDPCDLLDPVFRGEEIDNEEIEYKRARYKAKQRASQETMESMEVKPAKHLLKLRTAPDVSSGLRILELYQNLLPVRKALVSMLIFDDPAYLADNPDLARTASGILTAEKPKK